MISQPRSTMAMNFAADELPDRSVAGVSRISAHAILSEGRRAARRRARVPPYASMRRVED